MDILGIIKKTQNLFNRNGCVTIKKDDFYLEIAYEAYEKILSYKAASHNKLWMGDNNSPELKKILESIDGETGIFYRNIPAKKFSMDSIFI